MWDLPAFSLQITVFLKRFPIWEIFALHFLCKFGVWALFCFVWFVCGSCAACLLIMFRGGLWFWVVSWGVCWMDIEFLLVQFWDFCRKCYLGLFQIWCFSSRGVVVLVLGFIFHFLFIFLVWYQKLCIYFGFVALTLLFFWFPFDNVISILLVSDLIGLLILRFQLRILDLICFFLIASSLLESPFLS